MPLSAFIFSRSLRKQQKDTIRQLVFGGNLLVVLPTGFGKNLIFKLLVRVQEIIIKKALCVIVVCPLKSIVQDQISEASSMGLTAVALPVKPARSFGSVACCMLPGLRYLSNSFEIALQIPFLSSRAISWCLKRSFEAAWQFPWAICFTSFFVFLLTVWIHQHNFHLKSFVGKITDIQS